MDIQDDFIKRKLADINAIDFGDSVDEVSSTLLIVMTMFEVDDNKEIIKACKYKLYEGISKLKAIGETDKAHDLEKKLTR